MQWIKCNESALSRESSLSVQTNDKTFCSSRSLNKYLKLCKQNPTIESGPTCERNKDIETSLNTTSKLQNFICVCRNR